MSSSVMIPWRGAAVVDDRQPADTPVAELLEGVEDAYARRGSDEVAADEVAGLLAGDVGRVLQREGDAAVGDDADRLVVFDHDDAADVPPRPSSRRPPKSRVSRSAVTTSSATISSTRIGCIRIPLLRGAGRRAGTGCRAGPSVCRPVASAVAASQGSPVAGALGGHLRRHPAGLSLWYPWGGRPWGIGPWPWGGCPCGGWLWRRLALWLAARRLPLWSLLSALRWLTLGVSALGLLWASCWRLLVLGTRRSSSPRLVGESPWYGVIVIRRPPLLEWPTVRRFAPDPNKALPNDRTAGPETHLSPESPTWAHGRPDRGSPQTRRRRGQCPSPTTPRCRNSSTPSTRDSASLADEPDDAVRATGWRKSRPSWSGWGRNRRRRRPRPPPARERAQPRRRVPPGEGPELVTSSPATGHARSLHATRSNAE